MIDLKFHTANRHALADSIPGGLFVLSAYNSMQRSNECSFSFKQEANFWWLTGIKYPDWQLIIDGKSKKSWLVSPNLSDIKKIFDGCLSADSAISISGVDGVLNQDEANIKLSELAKSHKIVYVIGELENSEGFSFVINPAQRKLRAKVEQIFTNTQECNLELLKLRSIKQPVEIEAIKKSVHLTTNAFSEIKQKLTKFKFEYEVEAEFTYYFRKNGATGNGFDPIVASGKNACTLHYVDNNSKLNKNDLLLIDIGAQVGDYSADISRTYSLGSVTSRQVQVHQAVDEARKQIIGLLRPGLVISEYHNNVKIIMQNSLRQLDLLSTADNYQRYLPHGIGHGLGVDTHDSLGNATKFLPGMIITVEPGIYIPEEGIGVRIEDDILITDDGYENLSGLLPTGL